MRSLHDYRGEYRAARKRELRAANRWHRDETDDVKWLCFLAHRRHTDELYEAYMRACDRILGPLTHLHIDVESGTITSARVKP